MIKIFYCLFILLMFCTTKAYSQATLSAADEQKRQLVGLSVEKYTLFFKGLKELNKHYIDIINDKRLSKEQKKDALKKIELQKKAFVDFYLTEEQRKNLFEFEDSSVKAHSPHEKQKKELEQRLAKRGFTMKSN